MQIELITSILKYKDKDIFLQIKKDYLEPDIISIYDFIRDYIRDTAQLPEILTVEAEFSFKLPEVKEPPKFWLEKVKKRYEEIVIEDALKDALKTKSLTPFYTAVQRLIAVKVAEGYYEDSLKRYDDYLKKVNTKGLTYLPTGNSVLDEVMFGYNRGDYILLGGGEGTGKTFYLLRRANDLNKIINKISTEAKGRNILFFSLEMQADELKERLDAINCGISYRRLVLGRLTDEEQEIYKKYMDWQNKRIKLDHLKFITEANNVREIENFIIAYQPAMVFIDGIQLFSKSLDWKDMMKTSMDLRKLALTYRIPLFVTAHLKTKKGTTIDNVTSDDFAYFKGARDASIAMVMIRDEEMEVAGQTALKVVKGRKGQRATILFTDDFQTTSQEISEYNITE